MDKKEIVRILEEISILLDLKGENPFKSRAYSNAARVIESQNEDVVTLIKSGEISNIKGVGKAISEKLTILVNEKRLPYYESLKKETPPGLFDMLKIPGMGPKKVKAVYETLNISTVGELEYACKENRLRDLPGFGQKSQDKFLDPELRFLPALICMTESSRIIESCTPSAFCIRPTSRKAILNLRSLKLPSLIRAFAKRTL